MALILIGSALGIYYSPDYSWNASIRDSDSDGYSDDEDAFPNDSTEWADTDLDGCGDNSDAFPTEPTQWADSDGDGHGDNGTGLSPDAFPDDPNEWNDSDEDGVGDNCDEFPDDPDEWQDTDGDGYGDNEDAFPDDDTEWTDTDGDGVGDNCDEFPDDPSLWITTPTATYSRTTITNGVQICVVAITASDVSWDHVKVQLTDGTNSAEWSPTAANLDGGLAVSSNLTTQAMGSLTVCCIVFDIAGNGVVNGNDYFKLFTYSGGTAFSSSTTYTAVLVYEPSGETIGTGMVFTG